MILKTLLGTDCGADTFSNLDSVFRSHWFLLAVCGQKATIYDSANEEIRPMHLTALASLRQ